MLALRPNCEYCDKDLPPDAADAMICTYECTFCASCVNDHLFNVCPNCGGGLQPRPIRPAVARRDGVSLTHQPGSPDRVHLSYDKQNIAEFVAATKTIDPASR